MSNLASKRARENAMRPIEWKRSEDGYCDSKCGRWRIRPLFCTRVNPAAFELLRDGVVVGRFIEHSAKRRRRPIASVRRP